MKVIRRFNNNVVLCRDNNGQELVAFGKGIGFREIPYELSDLSLIERTYYGIENRYLNMINDLSTESFNISSKVLDWCRIGLEGRINPNMLFTMADHIDFCIERFKGDLIVRMPSFADIEILHPKEFEIASRALVLINHSFNIQLPKDEVVGITMNILNAELDLESNRVYKEIDVLMDEILEIIESDYAIRIDTSSVNYARYVSHMKYLMVRIDRNEIIKDELSDLYASISNDYPKAKLCANKINDYIIRTKNSKLNEDELSYLIIHINRLCVREECS